MNPSIHKRNYPLCFSKQRQSGVVMMIALIVLVSMTLAAIGMVRSIDTAGVVAGNLSLKQSTLSGADQGLEVAYQWLLANAGTTILDNTDLSVGYFSSASTAPVNWFDPNAWTNSLAINGGATDAAGTQVSYVIHRLCSEADTAYNGNGAGGTPNQCVLSAAATAAASGGSMTVNATTFTGVPKSYYRVTARARGPRNTESYVQSFLALTN